MQSAHPAKAAFELQPPQHTLKIIIATFMPCPPVLQYLETLQMSTCFDKLFKEWATSQCMTVFLNVKIATSRHITLYICILQETELPRVSGVCVAAPLTVQRWFGRYSLPEEEEGGGGVEHSSSSPLVTDQPFIPPSSFCPVIHWWFQAVFIPTSWLRETIKWKKK